MAQWSAFGVDADGIQLFDLDGGEVRDQKTYSTIVEARAKALQRHVHIGGRSEAVPTKVLPEGGNLFGDLVQDAPIGRLGGWARLWIAGFLSTRPDWDGVICLVDGDITHWAQISAEEVVSFQSYVTGRLVEVLGGGVKADASAIADSMSRPERLATHLRSAELEGLSDAITGYLIGAELAASRPYWLGQNVAVVAESSLYSDALGIQGVVAQLVSADDMRIAGFAEMAQKLGLVG